MESAMKICLAVLMSSCLLLGLSQAQAQQAPSRIRGDVVALQGAALQIRTAGGEALTVSLGDSARIMVESRVTLAAVVPGVFVGTTSEPQPDGTLRAVQIRIFPEALRGTGEGHRPMNTPAHNTMTNATVTRIAAASAPASLPASAPTMTNATVTALAGAAAQGHSMTLTYKDGAQRIVIPDDVAVIQAELGSRSQLVPGAHVVLTPGAVGVDGRISSDRVTIGKDGSMPM
jgi:hypothetical protein